MWLFAAQPQATPPVVLMARLIAAPVPAEAVIEPARPTPVVEPPRAVEKPRPVAKPRPRPRPRPAEVAPAPTVIAAPAAEAGPAVPEPVMREAEPAPAPVPTLAAVEAAAPATQAAPAAQAATLPRFDADYLDNPAPAYPAFSRRMREEGKVLLRVFVEPDGRPGRITVHTGSGSPRLDRAAEEAVWRWRFVPARRGEDAVGAWVLVPIVFTLRG